jgi:hypothetical protein
MDTSISLYDVARIKSNLNEVDFISFRIPPVLVSTSRRDVASLLFCPGSIVNKVCFEPPPSRRRRRRRRRRHDLGLEYFLRTEFVVRPYINATS